MHAKYWSENLSGRHHVENIGVDGRIKLDRILKKQSGNLSIGFIWLRIGTSGGLL